MKRLTLGASVLSLFLLSGDRLAAFCGFYVAKADARLFNKASQVVLVRDEDRTVLTMANDFKGDPKEFAIVIPVPTLIEKGQIHVAERGLIDHLDAYSAPRLVEYFDENPCGRHFNEKAMPMSAGAARNRADRELADSLGVKIEAQYTVGEYDILILSAAESSGLERWLRESGYRIPAGASSVLASYIRQNMRFFVARVNLQEQAKLGYSYLRPIQVAYESPTFMLPVRLGMVNADGPQELIVYALTRRGRVETTNYRTVRLASGMDVPLFVKDEFGSFYKALFSEHVKKENMQAVFTEYAWDMSWCDPCAADPLSQDELRNLGVYWLGDGGTPRPGPLPRPRILPAPGGAPAVFLTRLHVRYDREHFPEDLVFQETADRENFQGRFVLRHPWKGDDGCEAATRYRAEVQSRQEREAQTLASLTGWRIDEIRQKMKLEARGGHEPGGGSAWWQRIWDRK